MAFALLPEKKRELGQTDASRGPGGCLPPPRFGRGKGTEQAGTWWRKGKRNERPLAKIGRSRRERELLEELLLFFFFPTTARGPTRAHSGCAPRPRHFCVEYSESALPPPPLPFPPPPLNVDDDNAPRPSALPPRVRRPSFAQETQIEAQQGQEPVLGRHERRAPSTCSCSSRPAASLFFRRTRTEPQLGEEE